LVEFVCLVGFVYLVDLVYFVGSVHVVCSESFHLRSVLHFVSGGRCYYWMVNSSPASRPVAFNQNPSPTFMVSMKSKDFCLAYSLPPSG